MESRIQRVIHRDNSSREQVLKRINAQWNDDQRIAKSDYVIENDSIENAKSEVDKILKILKIQ
jgi:dephospho-CoA kinase